MLNMFTIVTNTEEKQAMVLALKNLADLLRDKINIYVYYLKGSALFRSVSVNKKVMNWDWICYKRVCGCSCAGHCPSLIPLP